MKMHKSISNGLAVFGALLVCGMVVAPVAPAVVIEDFEGYGVPSTMTLDPTTVAGSGWSREGIGDADWVVGCCGAGNVPADAPMDGSDSALYLRRGHGWQRSFHSGNPSIHPRRTSSRAAMT